MQTILTHPPTGGGGAVALAGTRDDASGPRYEEGQDVAAEMEVELEGGAPSDSDEPMR